MRKYRKVHKRFQWPDRFWIKVQKSETCWVWLGKHDERGRGHIYVEDGCLEFASKVSWILHFGSIPTGINVLHKCDNPSCVRPDHLFLGTQKVNMLDMALKRRSSTKLTWEQVAEIVKSVQAGVQQKLLAKRFNVCPATIHNALHRKTFKY